MTLSLTIQSLKIYLKINMVQQILKRLSNHCLVTFPDTQRIFPLLERGSTAMLIIRAEDVVTSGNLGTNAKMGLSDPI